MISITQKEFELGVSKELVSGDIAKISQISGIGYSYIDQQLNPNDERRSYLFGALQIICAIDEISTARGAAVMQLLIDARNASLPGHLNTNTVNEEAARVSGNCSAVLSSILAGKPETEQVLEAYRLRDQLDSLIDSIRYKQSKDLPVIAGEPSFRCR